MTTIGIELAMNKRRIFINAIMSIVQIIINIGVLFLLYRYLIITIGVKRLGMWSLVLATASVVSIANFGFSGSVVKFVAKYVALNQYVTVSRLVQTAAISTGIFLGFVSLAVYPFAGFILNLAMPTVNFEEGLSILPHALLFFWLNLIGTVFQSGLDGYQLIARRNIVLIVAALCLLFLSFLLVPVYGLPGLAYSYIAQAVIIMIGFYLMLKRQLPILPLFPYQWDYKLFREMLGYGLNFQVISISEKFIDPVTKSLLTKFGGLAMTGFYDMASRMILNLRWIILSANQVLVPTIADLQERDPKIIQTVYYDSYRLVFFITIPFFTAIILFTPFISKIWIGYYESTFISFSILLAIGCFVNILSMPAYIVNLGIGTLRWNKIGYLTIVMLNLLIGIVLGSVFGGIAVVIAYVFSLIIGSLIIFLAYHSVNKLPLSKVFLREDIGIVLSSIGSLFFFMMIYFLFIHDKFDTLINSIVVLSFLAIMTILVWIHPMRKRLTGWIILEFLKTK